MTVHTLFNVGLCLNGISIILLGIMIRRMQRRMDFIEAMHLIRLNHEEWRMSERVKNV